MRRLVFVFLVSSLLVTLGFVYNVNIPAVKASSSIYQGDLILNGNNVTTIENRRFDINGSIIVEENATLILRNAILNFTQMEHYQFNMTFRNPVNGNPRLEADNVTLVTDFWFGDIDFYGNTSARISGSDFRNSSMDAYGSSIVSISLSELSIVDISHSANVSVSNSTISAYIRNSHFSILSVFNCSISSLLVNGNKTTVSESSVDDLSLWASGINCTINNLKPGYFSYWNFLLNCSVERRYPYYSLGRNLTLLNTQINEWDFLNFHVSNVILMNSVITDLDVYDGSTLSVHSSEIEQLRCLGSIASINNSKIEKLLGSLRSSMYPVPEVRIYGNSNVTVNRFSVGMGGEVSYSSSTFGILSCHDNSSVQILGYVTMLGNITVWGDSELNLRNAVINFTQTHDEQFNMTFSGQSRLRATNATITSNYTFIVYFYENSSATFNHLKMPVTLAKLYSFLNATDSTIDTLYTYDDSTVWLLNSTYNSCGIYDQSEVYVSWYLDVHVVDSIDQNVPSANVTAAYPNTTVAESKLTGRSGWARLTLIEKMMNATDEYPVGNYTVEATYDIHSDDSTVNMTENKQITLTLEDFIIPEFPSYLILPLFMITTLLAVIACRRKRSI